MSRYGLDAHLPLRVMVYWNASGLVAGNQLFLDFFGPSVKSYFLS